MSVYPPTSNEVQSILKQKTLKDSIESKYGDVPKSDDQRRSIQWTTVEVCIFLMVSAFSHHHRVSSSNVIPLHCSYLGILCCIDCR